MLEWYWFVAGYLVVSILLCMTDEDCRNALFRVATIPLLIVPALFVLLVERVLRIGGRWNVPNRSMFTSLQSWWDANPEVNIRLLHLRGIAILWSTKGTNMWKTR